MHPLVGAGYREKALPEPANRRSLIAEMAFQNARPTAAVTPAIRPILSSVDHFGFVSRISSGLYSRYTKLACSAFASKFLQRFCRFQAAAHTSSPMRTVPKGIYERKGPAMRNYPIVTVR